MKLHNFDAEHIDEDLRNRLIGLYENELFFNCIFDDISNVKLMNCELNRSKFLTDTPDKCRNFAITMECRTFAGVELSEFLFNMILYFLTLTKGHPGKRLQIIEIIGEEKYKEMAKMLKTLE